MTGQFPSRRQRLLCRSVNPQGTAIGLVSAVRGALRCLSAEQSADSPAGSKRSVCVIIAMAHFAEGKVRGLRFRFTPSRFPPSSLYCLGAGAVPAAGGIAGSGWAAAGVSRVCACLVSFVKASSMASDVILPMSVLV